MKKYLIYTVLFVLMFGCDNNSNDATRPIEDLPLVGILYIVDQKSDETGFKPVASNKKIAFLEDNTVIVDGDLCEMTIASDPDTTGSYVSLSLDAFDGEIIPNDCTESSVYYKVNGNTLTLFYQCIDYCEQRYIKQ